MNNGGVMFATRPLHVTSLLLGIAGLGQSFLAAQTPSRRLPREAVRLVATARMPADCPLACVYVRDGRFGNLILLDENNADSTTLAAAVFRFLVVSELGESQRLPQAAIRVPPEASQAVLGDAEVARAARVLRVLLDQPKVRDVRLGQVRTTQIRLPRGYFRTSGRLYRNAPH